MNKSISGLRQRIQAARGDIPVDLVLKKGRVVDLFSGVVRENDIAIYDGRIVGLGSHYHGREELDLQKKWVIPGLIDAHLHIESSMLLPSKLAAALLPHGTTTIVSDPHEIGNVMGIEGVRFMLRESQSIPFDVFMMAPSCVPATHLETSGARLDLLDLEELKREPRILGLAEMMNFPGVLGGIPEVLEKLMLYEDRVIDGHGPYLSGKDLQAYLTAGIKSDHETSDFNEGREKIESGMMLMIREGTSAKNLEELLPLVNDRNSGRFCFVSDDLHPQDILLRGHLDFMIKKAVALGMNPVTAVRLATLNPAQYLCLRDRGAIAAGYRADLVILADLERLTIESVYKNGSLVVEKGEIKGVFHEREQTIEPRPLNISPITPESFRIRSSGLRGRVIQIVQGQILTKTHVAEIASENGWVVSDTGSDILKLAVVERHKATGRIGLGLVKGFGLKQGAMASSVAHDSHNVVAVGVSDRDIYRAVEEVRIMGGGMAVVQADRVLARVPLEVAGLMSTASLGGLVNQLEDAKRAAVSLGCKIQEPFMSLSFLALPVIPELKLTDLGLVDVNKFDIVPLFVED